MPDLHHCCCPDLPPGKCNLCVTLRVPVGTGIPPTVFDIEVLDADENVVASYESSTDYYTKSREFLTTCFELDAGTYTVNVTQREVDISEFDPDGVANVTLGESFAGTYTAVVVLDCDEAYPPSTIFDVKGAVFVSATSRVACAADDVASGHELSITGPGGSASTSGVGFLVLGLLTTTPGTYEACASAPDHDSQCKSAASSSSPTFGHNTVIELYLKLATGRVCCNDSYTGKKWISTARWRFACKYGTVDIDFSDPFHITPPMVGGEWIVTFYESGEAKISATPSAWCCANQSISFPPNPCPIMPTGYPFSYCGDGDSSPVHYRFKIECDRITCTKVVWYRICVEDGLYGSGWVPVSAAYASTQDISGSPTMLSALEASATSIVLLTKLVRPVSVVSVPIDMGQTASYAFNPSAVAAWVSTTKHCPPAVGSYGPWDIPGDETVTFTPIW